MKESIYKKLEVLKERYEELKFLLSTEDIINNQNKEVKVKLSSKLI